MACYLYAFLILLTSSWISYVQSAITGESVTLASYDAGATGTVDIAFTHAIDVPIGGAIVFIFPPNFKVAPTTISNIVGFDPSSTMVTNTGNRMITITINGNMMIAGGKAFRIDGITNPGAGTTGTYIIRTISPGPSSNTLESSSVTGSVIVFTPLTEVTVTLASTSAGVTTYVIVAFKTGIDLPIGSRIELQFPALANSNFLFTSVTVSNLVGIDVASTSIQVSPPFLRLTIDGAPVNADASVSMRFNGVINPAAQTTGTFVVRTLHPSVGTFQELTGITGVTITATTLTSSAKIVPQSYFGGQATSYTLSFSNAAHLSTGSKIVWTFPPRFELSSVTFGSASNIPTTNTVFTVSATTLTWTLGSALLVGVDRSLTVNGVLNPGSSCNLYILNYCTTTWEPYSITFFDSGGINIYQQSSTVPGTPIIKKPFSFARVRPYDPTPSIVTKFRIIFDTTARIPVGGKIEVVFPTGFLVNTGTVVSSHLGGISTTSTAVTVTGNQISLEVATSAVSATSGLGLTFDKITTPKVFTTGFYILRTRDALGFTMEESQQIAGEGCLYLNSCNGHGTCTIMSKTCICEPGWGAPTDIASYKAPDCTLRVCPAGASWNSVPADATIAHTEILECSGMGICDRGNGKCICFPGFTGKACERMTCPNSCSGKGQCVTMKEMAKLKYAQPLSLPTTYTGLSSTTTWDEDRVMGCACDSAWAVGPGLGELQVTEYFGGDCSRRRCPTGDDPDTTVDETNCEGKLAPDGFIAGGTGNKCYVPCSNRGICNFKTGVCTCFKGYTGFSCSEKDALKT